MTNKICITFNDPSFNGIMKYKKKYNVTNVPEAIKQIVNRYLIEVEGQ